MPVEHDETTDQDPPAPIYMPPMLQLSTWVQSASLKTPSCFPYFQRCLPVEGPVAPIAIAPKDFSTPGKPELWNTLLPFHPTIIFKNESVMKAKNAAMRRNVLITYVSPNIPLTGRPWCRPKRKRASKFIPGGAYWRHQLENKSR
jgi:hypothetical protein